MKVFKDVKQLDVYKYGYISPVLYGTPPSQNQYFKKLWQEGIEIPPQSGDVYHLKPTTFKRWLREYRKRGLEGLATKIRSDKGKCRKITPRLLSAIEEVKEEFGAVSVSDLYRKLIINGFITTGDLSRETLRLAVKTYRLLQGEDAVKKRKKFEKEFIDELWMVDFKEGRSVRQGNRLRRTYLCAIIDDASRVLVGYEWGFNQDTTLFAKTFKKAVSVYGIPRILYSDQGKVFRSQYIMEICARLEVSMVNAPPYSPESKAKIERFNRTVQQMFYPLVKDFRLIDMEELNRLFDRFVRDIYHLNPHSSLGEAPICKFQRLLAKTTIKRIKDQQLEQFFLCSMKRKVRLDGTISVNNTYYEVDMKHVGEYVDIHFPVDDPASLFLLENGKPSKPLKPVDLIQNANPPHVSISYSKFSVN